MRILKTTILSCSLISACLATNPAEALEVAAWNGTTVGTFASGYQAPSSFLTPGVDNAGTGGKVGALITITAGVGDLRDINMVLGGYLQFKVKADADTAITIESFELVTAAAVGLATSISYSTSEDSGYTGVGSLASLSLGTNSYTFSSPVTIAAGDTAYFRFDSSLAGTIVYNVTQPTVFAFVPEPSTYAMSAAGIAVLGYAGRKRRKPAARDEA